jgi:predicted RNA-binding protein with PUA-like domain
MLSGHGPFQPPANAWLLIGDEASYPTAEDLEEMHINWDGVKNYLIWTGSKQTQPGDLLLFYFMHPTKEVRFIARALDYPYFDVAMVNANRDVDDRQWWVTHSPLIKLARPIPFRDLSEALNGHLILRGKPSHYLPPSAVRKLLGSPPDHQGAYQMPTGNPTLPDPSRVRLAGWNRIADGALTNERMVEEHIVKPLLRLALAGTGAMCKGQVRLDSRGIPDFVIYRREVPTAIVEAKLAIPLPHGGSWGDTKEAAQAARYSSELGVPAMLIDSNRVVLLKSGQVSPTKGNDIQRGTVTLATLDRIREHLLNQGNSRRNHRR